MAGIPKRLRASKLRDEAWNWMDNRKHRQYEAAETAAARDLEEWLGFQMIDENGHEVWSKEWVRKNMVKKWEYRRR